MQAIDEPSALCFALLAFNNLIVILLYVVLGITALAMHHQTAPPTINLEHPDPDCDLDYVPRKCRPVKMEYALSNSFGFGGTNAALLFKKHE